MNFIEKFTSSMATVYQTTETVLTTINPYVPLLTAATGVLMTADGVRRMVKNGVSSSALVETVMGLGLSVIAYNTLSNLAPLSGTALHEQVRQQALQTAKDNTHQVLSRFVGGISNPEKVAINCTLYKWSEVSINTAVNPERLGGDQLSALCTVTNVQVMNDTPLHSTLGSVCRLLSSTFSARGNGAPEPRIIGQVLTYVKIA